MKFELEIENDSHIQSEAAMGREKFGGEKFAEWGIGQRLAYVVGVLTPLWGLAYWGL
jgi:hypothetical protein